MHIFCAGQHWLYDSTTGAWHLQGLGLDPCFCSMRVQFTRLHGVTRAYSPIVQNDGSDLPAHLHGWVTVLDWNQVCSLPQSFALCMHLMAVTLNML